MEAEGPPDHTIADCEGQALSPKEKQLYRIFFLLGCGTLFPYNAFITAADYFDSQYPGQHTDRLITVSYLPIMMLLLTALVLQKRRPARRTLIILGLCGFLLSMSVIPLWGAAGAGSLPLPAMLLFVAITGVSDSLVQCALFGEAALLPERYTQALVSGTAASGATVSVLRIVTKAALPYTPSGLRHSAELYFVSAAVVVALCLYVYAHVLPHMPLYLQYMQSAEALPAGRWLLPQEYPRSNDDSRAPGGLVDRHPGVPTASSVPSTAAKVAVPEGDSQETGRGGFAMGLEVEGGGSPPPAKAPYRRVLRDTWPLYLALMFVYVITLSIFPGFLAEDVSSATLTDWYPVLLIAAFNFADLAGKEMPAWGCLPRPSRGLMLAAALSRLAFVPAFALAARLGGGPAVMGLLTLALGASNGYVTAVLMMAAPRAFLGAEAEAAGNLSILALVLGLCLGAAASFLWLV